MLALTGDAAYADVLERVLYNGVNSGLSLSGNLYCYRNPLASDGDKLRNPWYDTTCCPPNIERLFESLPGYVYGMSRDGVYVNLFHTSELNWRLEDGTGLKIAQTTNYPWNGDIKVAVNPAQAALFTLYLRWPSWAPAAEVQVNGQTVPLGAAKRGSYVAIERKWSPGDMVTFNLPMSPVVMASNPRISDDYGRVAMQRGPLVYAMEQIDQNGVSLADAFVKFGGLVTAEIRAEVRKDLLGGVTVLKVPGLAAEKPVSDEPLYQPLVTALGRSRRPTALTFIPYYAIGNRDPTPMEVWAPLMRVEPNIENKTGTGYVVFPQGFPRPTRQ